MKKRNRIFFCVLQVIISLQIVLYTTNCTLIIAYVRDFWKCDDINRVGRRELFKTCLHSLVSIEWIRSNFVAKFKYEFSVFGSTPQYIKTWHCVFDFRSNPITVVLRLHQVHCDLYFYRKEKEEKKSKPKQRWATIVILPLTYGVAAKITLKSTLRKG